KGAKRNSQHLKGIPCIKDANKQKGDVNYVYILYLFNLAALITTITMIYY
ncbi:hypothetical protein IGA_05282, partial [Bacillus cereus HuA3-9]